MANQANYTNWANLASTVVNSRVAWLAQDKRQKLSKKQYQYQNSLLDSQQLNSELDFNANLGELNLNSLSLIGQYDTILSSRGIQNLDKATNKNRDNYNALFNKKAKEDLARAKAREAERLRNQQEIKASQAQQRAEATSNLIQVAVTAGMLLL